MGVEGRSIRGGKPSLVFWHFGKAIWCFNLSVREEKKKGKNNDGNMALQGH